MGLNMKPLLREAARRYQETGTKKEKSAILDELVGYRKMNRKYLVHVLANAGRTKAVRKTAAGKRRKGGGRKPIYSGEFAVALRAIWAFFWYRRRVPAHPDLHGCVFRLDGVARGAEQGPQMDFRGADGRQGLPPVPASGHRPCVEFINNALLKWCQKEGTWVFL